MRVSVSTDYEMLHFLTMSFKSTHALH